jgi:thiamine-monophosphate kinase
LEFFGSPIRHKVVDGPIDRRVIVLLISWFVPVRSVPASIRQPAASTKVTKVIIHRMLVWRPMPRLDEMGEKEIVRQLIGSMTGQAAVGPGDDAAAVDLGSDYLVVTTDTVTRRGHLPKGMTHWQTGWFTAAVNYSDVAAMGARPLGIVVAMALPRDMQFASVQEIMHGVEDCSAFVGGEVLGGDTKEAGELVLTGTAMGIVPKEGILLRRGAREGDMLATTGPIGLAAAGFRAVEHDWDCPQGIASLFEPVPRTREGMLLSSSGSVTSCMDITDGLFYSIGQLSRASGVGFRVERTALPIPTEVEDISARTGEDPLELATSFGGDYELLFTFSPGSEGLLRSLLGDRFHILGRAEGRENFLITEGKVVSLVEKGYEHFGR